MVQGWWKKNSSTVYGKMVKLEKRVNQLSLPVTSAEQTKEAPPRVGHEEGDPI